MDDCISRQAAIDALAKFVPYAICDESTESYTNGLTDAYNLILQLPSAQPERKKGKWNEERFKHLLTGEIRPVRVCSVCDAGWFRYDITDGVEDFTPKFCPNCGADMRGEE